jgi:hypothetical protein
MPDCAAGPWIKTNEKGPERAVPGALASAVMTNAAAPSEFHVAASGTHRAGRGSGFNGMELIMVEHRKSVPSRQSAARKTRARPAPKRWSQRVTKASDALDLKHGVFKLTDPKRIAASLKRSAERSSRRKAGAYRSALSMLTFYINRAGKTLPKTQRDRLERAKTELKHQFHRD